MMSKFVRRVIPFESCDIPAIQSWLEDMAKKGLLFRECGVFFARFEKAEPRNVRYRLDFCDVAACDIPEEKKSCMSGRVGTLSETSKTTASLSAPMTPTRRRYTRSPSCSLNL